MKKRRRRIVQKPAPSFASCWIVWNIIYKAMRTNLHGDLSEEEIYAQCDADNHAILLKKGAPEGKRVGLRVWQRAIPQYRRGHLQILKELEEDERKAPGLYLGGNYRTGVAFGDCVAFGVNEAKRVADFLNMRDDASSSSSSAKEVVDNNNVAV